MPRDSESTPTLRARLFAFEARLYDRRFLWIGALIIFALGLTYFRNGHFFFAGPNGRPAPCEKCNDQQIYFTMARSMADGTLNAETFLYGPGYPLLGAPFHAWANPFYLVDIVVGLVATWFSLAALRTWFGPLIALASAALLVIQTSFAECAFIVPWNSVVSVAGFAVMWWACTREAPLTRPIAAGLGAMLGWVFAARYIDVIFIGALALPVIARELRRWRGRESAWLFVCAFAALGVLVGAVLWSHAHFLGGVLHSPYLKHLRVDRDSDQQFLSYDYGSSMRNFWQVWVSSPQSILRSFPELILMPFGMYFLWCRPGLRLTLAVYTATFFAWNFFYCAYFLTAHNLMYGALRYVAPWFFLMSGVAIYGAYEVAIRAAARIAR